MRDEAVNWFPFALRFVHTSQIAALDNCTNDEIGIHADTYISSSLPSCSIGVYLLVLHRDLGLSLLLWLDMVTDIEWIKNV